MWSSGGERTEKQMWISLRELNPQMMEHCSFEAIRLMLVCQVHISVLSQYVSRFSRGNLSNLNHQGRNSWELVRLCSYFVWFLQFNHFCVFSAFSFLTENELPLSPYTFLSNISFSVKSCFKDMRTSTQLTSESVVSKDHRELWCKRPWKVTCLTSWIK